MPYFLLVKLIINIFILAEILEKVNKK